METVDDLKSDIAKKDVIVKMEQQRLKKQIDEGMFDDAEEILSNPETENYYKEALSMLKNQNLEETTKTSEDKKENENLWVKFKKNLKKVILQ